MIINETEGDYIAHFGIKGQKWGLRRFQSYLTAPTRSGMVGQEVGEAAKHDIEADKEKYKNSPSQMYKHRDLYTTKELNDAIQRFNAEDALKRKIKERNPLSGVAKSGQRMLEQLTIGAASEVGKTIVKAKLNDALNNLDVGGMIRNAKSDYQISNAAYEMARSIKKGQKR